MGGTARSFLRGLIWAAMAFALALAGCGDLSLVDALHSEAPGGLRLSPDTALVPEGTSFTFLVLGGFLPYNLTASAALTAEDDHTYLFGGGTAPAGGTRQYPIEAVDQLGNTATAIVTVYALSPLALSAQSITLLEGDDWTFTASGGQVPYTWSLDGVAQEPIPDTDAQYTFPLVPPGDYTVSVSDAIGMTRAAMVQVVAVPPPSSPLALSPASATVLVNGTVVFTALGGSGSYVFEATGGSIAPSGNPAVYTAPSIRASYYVKLSDDGGATFPVSAMVNVVNSPAQALSLVPGSPTVSALGASIEFAALGGTAPFAFVTDHPEWGSIEATGLRTALYTQLAERNVMVRVTDADGTSASTMVKWQ